MTAYICNMERVAMDEHSKDQDQFDWLQSTTRIDTELERSTDNMRRKAIQNCNGTLSQKEST